jgi:hypothetical protein
VAAASRGTVWMSSSGGDRHLKFHETQANLSDTARRLIPRLSTT